MTLTTAMRNGKLPELVTLLKDQSARRVDVVASGLKAKRGRIVVPGGGEPTITESGVTPNDLSYGPNDLMIGQIGTRLGVPVKYIRSVFDRSAVELAVTGEAIGVDATGKAIMSTPWTDLLDEIMQTHLDDVGGSHLLRGLRTDDAEIYGRAMLSSSYKMIDNYDVLLSALEGIRETGADVLVDQCNLSDTKMRVRFWSPEIKALAPTLLRNYRTPFERPDGGGHGQEGLRDDDGNLPVVFAGFELSNSETGGGAFMLTPVLRVKICTNGMVMKSDALREIHLGGKMKDGLITWSAETQEKSAELVRLKARDAVASFMDVDYITGKITEMEADSNRQIREVVPTIERISKTLRFTETEEASILDCFMRSGQADAGGVLHAVTAAAQTIPDPDRAWEVESLGLDAMALV